MSLKWDGSATPPLNQAPKPKSGDRQGEAMSYFMGFVALALPEAVQILSGQQLDQITRAAIFSGIALFGTLLIHWAGHRSSIKYFITGGLSPILAELQTPMIEKLHLNDAWNSPLGLAAQSLTGYFALKGTETIIAGGRVLKNRVFDRPQK